MSLASPFPGMDPYTEARQLWKGIHTQLIGELSTHLLPPLLAPVYYVDVEPSLQVRSGQSLFPDLQILTAHRQPLQKPPGFALPVVEATMQLTTLPEEEEEEVREDPWLALLRWGQRVVAGLPTPPYHILITRADEQPQGRVWSFSLAEPIPTVPLPLIEQDEYVPLPLQEAYTTIYQARNFYNRLDYTVDHQPPLTAGQRASIQQQLTASQLRRSSNRG